MVLDECVKVSIKWNYYYRFSIQNYRKSNVTWTDEWL